MLALALLVACGGDDKAEDTSATGTGTGTGTASGTPAGTPAGTTPTGGTTGTDCPFTGTVEGCLAYEADCSTPDASYTVDGGWFDDTQAGNMVLRLGNNASNQYWEFLISTDEITVDVDYEWPSTLTGKLVDVSNPDTTAITTICAGRLRITEWEPGSIVKGTWVAQAELGNGPCEDNQFWASRGSFEDLAPCSE